MLTIPPTMLPTMLPTMPPMMLPTMPQMMMPTMLPMMLPKMPRMMLPKIPPMMLPPMVLTMLPPMVLPNDRGVLEPGVPETVLLQEGTAVPHRERGLVLVEGARGIDVPPGPVPLRRCAAEDVLGRGEAAGDGLDDHLAGIQEGHDGVVPSGTNGLVVKDERTRRKRRVEDGNAGEKRPAMVGRVGGQWCNVRIVRKEWTA